MQVKQDSDHISLTPSLATSSPGLEDLRSDIRQFSPADMVGAEKAALDIEL